MDICNRAMPGQRCTWDRDAPGSSMHLEDWEDAHAGQKHTWQPCTRAAAINGTEDDPGTDRNSETGASAWCDDDQTRASGHGGVHGPRAGATSHLCALCSPSTYPSPGTLSHRLQLSVPLTPTPCAPPSGALSHKGLRGSPCWGPGDPPSVLSRAWGRRRPHTPDRPVPEGCLWRSRGWQRQHPPASSRFQELGASPRVPWSSFSAPSMSHRPVSHQLSRSKQALCGAGPRPDSAGHWALCLPAPPRPSALPPLSLPSSLLPPPSPSSFLPPFPSPLPPLLRPFPLLLPPPLSFPLFSPSQHSLSPLL